MYDLKPFSGHWINHTGLLWLSNETFCIFSKAGFTSLCNEAM